MLLQPIEYVFDILDSLDMECVRTFQCLRFLWHIFDSPNSSGIECGKTF